MGNLIGRKKKVVAEELETISHQLKAYRDDIDKTAEGSRMLLWYLTWTTFFFSTSGVGYVWVSVEEKNNRVLLSVSLFLVGLLLLWSGRRCINMYYNWRLDKKKQALDRLLEKKRTILESVKETETFKVASEILEKYDKDDATNMDSTFKFPKQAQTPGFPNSKGEPNPAGSVVRRSGKITATTTPAVQPSSMMTPFRGNTIMTPLRGPPGTIPRPPSVRPFHKESASAVEKVVDYFFGDGPSNRLALICSNCYGHNGMALPHEYEYLAFVCFICSHFNPAKKLRRPLLDRPVPSTPMTREVAKTSQQMDSKDDTSATDVIPEEKSDFDNTEDEFDIIPSRISAPDGSKTTTSEKSE